MERVAQHIVFEYQCFDRITTLVDLYGFAGAAGRDKRALEQAILSKSREQIAHFRGDWVLPYVQQYEFEALLFSDVDRFEWVQDGWCDRAHQQLKAIRAQFATAEDINNGPQTAPSKRIAAVFAPGQYSKVVHGPLIAEAIGLPRIRAECRGFDDWVSALEAWGDPNASASPAA